MPDTKITALTALTAADPANDVLPIVDVSDTTMAASGTTKKISINNVLGASGTATLASATITGDLTVATNRFAVSASGVGIGTTTMTYNLNVTGTAPTVTGIKLINTSGTSSNLCMFSASSAYSSFGVPNNAGWLAVEGSNPLAIGPTGNGGIVFVNNGSEAMRLNSTGLGVGGAPLSGFRLNVNNGDFRVSDVQNEDGVEIGWSAGAGSGFVQVYNRTTSAFKDLVLNNAATITATGNVGIGVTPSATNSTYFQALEIARVGQGLTAAKNVLTGSPSSWLSNNSYATYSSGVVWNYAISQPAAQYRLFEGQHQWYTAPSGTAGNAITFTERLRLKETGQLRFVPLASDPSGAEAGDVYYNSTSNKLKCYNGTTWNDLF